MSHATHRDAWRAWDAPARAEDRRTRLDRTAHALLRSVSPVRSTDHTGVVEEVLGGGTSDAKATDAELRARANECASAFALGRAQREDLVAAVRVIRELAKRTIGLHMHPVQVAAGVELVSGRLVELATGEGKTLVATIPAIVRAWRRRGCHVLTTNDYLVERDRALNTPLFDALGLTSACITGDSTRDERAAAYAKDITYLTAREACADHLRDRVDAQRVRSLPGSIAERLTGSGGTGPVQRGLASAIVDEADALLIDDAVTPLVLSTTRETDDQKGVYSEAESIARSLASDRDYRIDEGAEDISLTPQGYERAVHKQQWSVGTNRAHELVVTALRARHFFERDRAYIIEDGRLVIVDPATGRPTPDRTWRDGLHEAIEAKEGLEHTPGSRTLASLSFQSFFRRYEHVCGMSGTVLECAHETRDIYNLSPVSLPTHHPNIRTREPDRLFVRSKDKLRDVRSRVEHCLKDGRPVLIGVRSVQTSEQIASLLESDGIRPRLLNARRPEEEASIIAAAGRVGSVTVATGMAGRGTDILLDKEARAAGGLHVIVAELHDSARADRQLLGRAGRQGDPGSGVVLASLEDRVLERHLPRRMRNLIARSVSETVPGPLANALIRIARSRAEREARARRSRLVRTDARKNEAVAFAGALD